MCSLLLFSQTASGSEPGDAAACTFRSKPSNVASFKDNSSEGIIPGISSHDLHRLSSPPADTNALLFCTAVPRVALNIEGG